MGFVDDDVIRLLGLDAQREVAISLVPLGRGAELFPEQSIPLEQLGYQTAPYSEKEVDYPLMRQAHEASSLMSEEEVKGWRSRGTVNAPC
jgi:hypothetical protein